MLFATIGAVPDARCRAGGIERDRLRLNHPNRHPAAAVLAPRDDEDANGEWRMRGVMILGGVMIGLGTVMAQVADHMTAASAGTSSAASAMMIADATGDGVSATRSVVVPRDRRGHFQTEARVDGQRLRFMVDTGASVIAINESSAERIGIRPAPDAFSTAVSTANGTVKAARTRLAMVQVGDLTVHDVDAMVLPDAALSQNLLGLSFLGRLKRFEYAGGRLVLEQ